MKTSVFSTLCSRPPFLLSEPPRRHVSLLSNKGRRCRRFRAANVPETNDESSPLTAEPQETVEPIDIRFKRGSRRQAMEESRRRVRQESTNGSSKSPKQLSTPPKDWDSMTLTEKATELYVGEKGILFWLNKFAYASIFIMIGGWIVFRFVGPSLGLYQLDDSLLPPSQLLKSS